MRLLATILLVLGIPWALIAWIAVFGGPVGAIGELAAALQHRERPPGAMNKIPMALLWSAQAVFGYVIWGGWMDISTGWSTSTRRFWIVAAAHHLGWVALFGSQNGYNAPMGPVAYWYSIVLVGVCAAAAVATRGRGRHDTCSPPPSGSVTSSY